MSKYSHSGMQSDVSYAQKSILYRFWRETGTMNTHMIPLRRADVAMLQFLSFAVRGTVWHFGKDVCLFSGRERDQEWWMGISSKFSEPLESDSFYQSLLGFLRAAHCKTMRSIFPTLEQDSIKKTHRSICFSFRAVTLLCVGLVFSVQVGDSDISCFNNKVVLHIYWHLLCSQQRTSRFSKV